MVIMGLILSSFPVWVLLQWKGDVHMFPYLEEVTMMQHESHYHGCTSAGKLEWIWP